MKTENGFEFLNKAGMRLVFWAGAVCVLAVAIVCLTVYVLAPIEPIDKPIEQPTTVNAHYSTGTARLHKRKEAARKAKEEEELQDVQFVDDWEDEAVIK